jgi:hypothetical protein
MVAWASIASIGYYLAHVADARATYPGEAFLAVFALFNFIGLWASSEVGRRLAELEPAIDALLPGVEESARDVFARVGSTVGPLAFTLVATALFEFTDFVAAPSLAVGLRIVPAFIGQMAGAAFIWVYLALLAGLVRLGGRPLNLPSYLTDPGLGLRPFGRLAFIGFVGITLMIGAFVATTGGDQRTDAIAIVVIPGLGILFFASLYRLHQRMLAVKREHMAWARGLYAAALAPVEASPTAATVERQSATLLAAGEIERRVKEIAEWPFDDWVLRAVVAILLGAMAGLVARAVATGIGI